MPDDTVLGGPGGDAPTSETTAKTDGSDSSLAGQDSPYLGTWKTKDDADKGLENLNKQLNETRSRADKAESLASVLEKLSNQQQTPQGPTPEQQQAERQQLINSLDENMDGAMVIGLLEDAMARTEEAATSRASKETEALKQALGQLTNQLNDQNPEWREVAPLIDELGLKDVLGENADRATMIKVAKAIQSAKGPIQPDSAAVPGSTGGQAVLADGGGGVDAQTEQAVQGIVSALTGRKPTEAQHERAAKKWSK